MSLRSTYSGDPNYTQFVGGNESPSADVQDEASNLAGAVFYVRRAAVIWRRPPRNKSRADNVAIVLQNLLSTITLYPFLTNLNILLTTGKCVKT